MKGASPGVFVYKSSVPTNLGIQLGPNDTVASMLDTLLPKFPFPPLPSSSQDQQQQRQQQLLLRQNSQQKQLAGPNSTSSSSTSPALLVSPPSQGSHINQSASLRSPRGSIAQMTSPGASRGGGQTPLPASSSSSQQQQLMNTSLPSPSSSSLSTSPFLTSSAQLPGSRPAAFATSSSSSLQARLAAVPARLPTVSPARMSASSPSVSSPQPRPPSTAPPATFSYYAAASSSSSAMSMASSAQLRLVAATANNIAFPTTCTSVSGITLQQQQQQSSPSSTNLLSVRLNSGGFATEAGPPHSPAGFMAISSRLALPGSSSPATTGLQQSGPRFPAYMQQQQQGGGGSSSGGILCNLLSPNPDSRSLAAR